MGQVKMRRTVKNVKTLVKTGGWGIAVFGGLCFTMAFFSASQKGMFISILLLLSGGLCFAVAKFFGHMNYLLFLLSFFSFMLGRMTADFLAYGTIGLPFSENTANHMLLSIALSLAALQRGFCFSAYFLRKAKRYVVWSKKRLRGDGFRAYNHRLRNYGKSLFFLSAFFVVAVNLERFVFIQTHSYVELYTGFISRIPRVLQIIGNMYLASFSVYLATCPKKKECVFPICVFLFITGSVLLTGDRGEFIINTAMVLVYVFWRQNRDGEVWIGSEVIICGIIALPFMIAGLSFFVYLREGVDIGELSLLSQFTRFFRVTGKTVDILGYGKDYAGQLPRSFYSLGELIDYCIYNPITRAVLDIEKPKAHTVEYAQTMRSFAHSISFYITPDTYLNGHGLGSAYVAEVYYDFGYVGIVVCNFIYGYFMASFYYIKKERPMHIAACLIAMRIMFYIPRGAAIQPVTYVLNITTIFALGCIWFAARFVRIACLRKG